MSSAERDESLSQKGNPFETPTSTQTHHAVSLFATHDSPTTHHPSENPSMLTKAALNKKDVARLRKDLQALSPDDYEEGMTKTQLVAAIMKHDAEVAQEEEEEAKPTPKASRSSNRKTKVEPVDTPAAVAVAPSKATKAKAAPKPAAAAAPAKAKGKAKAVEPVDVKGKGKAKAKAPSPTTKTKATKGKGKAVVVKGKGKKADKLENDRVDPDLVNLKDMVPEELARLVKDKLIADPIWRRKRHLPKRARITYDRDAPLSLELIVTRMDAQDDYLHELAADFDRMNDRLVSLVMLERDMRAHLNTLQVHLDDPVIRDWKQREGDYEQLVAFFHSLDGRVDDLLQGGHEETVEELKKQVEACMAELKAQQDSLAKVDITAMVLESSPAKPDGAEANGVDAAATDVPVAADAPATAEAPATTNAPAATDAPATTDAPTVTVLGEKRPREDGQDENDATAAEPPHKVRAIRGVGRDIRRQYIERKEDGNVEIITRSFTS